MRAVVYIAFLIAAVSVAVFSDSGREAAIGASVAALFVLADLALMHRDGLLIAIKCAVRHPKTLVRISAAYAFRIQVGDKFLLIRGGRYPNQFQPIGGVFKVIPSGKGRLSELGALDDSLLPVDRDSTDDLRIRIDGRKVAAFLQWFGSGTGRETSPWREFQEELLASGYLTPKDFPFLVHEHLRTVQVLRQSAHYQGPELLISVVHDATLTPSQVAAIEEACVAHSHHLRLFSADEILRMGAVPGQQPMFSISANSAWLIKS